MFAQPLDTYQAVVLSVQRVDTEVLPTFVVLPGVLQCLEFPC